MLQRMRVLEEAGLRFTSKPIKDLSTLGGDGGFLHQVPHPYSNRSYFHKIDWEPIAVQANWKFNVLGFDGSHMSASVPNGLVGYCMVARP